MSRSAIVISMLVPFAVACQAVSPEDAGDTLEKQLHADLKGSAQERDKGDFVVAVPQSVDDGAATTDLNREWERFTRKEGHLERTVKLLNEEFALPRDLSVAYLECGEANAFFDPANDQVGLCYEMLQEIAEVVSARITSESSAADIKAAEKAALGISDAILMHEIGHALISERFWDVPVLGEEEDVVDDFSTLVLIELDRPDAAEATARFWATTDPMSPDWEAYAGVHSLNPQRYANIMCLVYGSNPKKYGHLTNPYKPDHTVKQTFEAVGRDCTGESDYRDGEFDQKITAFYRLIGPWVLPDDPTSTSQPDAI